MRAVAVPLTTDVPIQTAPRESSPAASGELLRRKRLARQRRLLHVQVARLDQPCVGGDQISCGEAHQVTWDDLATRALCPDPVTQDRGRRGDLPPELVGGLLRSPGLREVDDDAEHDHAGDERRVDPFPQERRQAARDEEHQRQRIAQEREQLGERGSLAVSGLVRPVLREAGRGLPGAKTSAIDGFEQGGVHGGPMP